MADNFVPTADGAQDIGTPAKRWGEVYSRQIVSVKTAGEILNGGRVVFVGADGKLYMADNTVLAEVKAVVGISQGAAVAEAPANYITGDSVSEAGWAWTPGSRIYFDNLGMLVDVAPATGNLRSVGVADTATSILVNVGEVIAR